MKKTRKTILISDLHLEKKQPPITNAFLGLLRDHAADIDALYILGDFFESWVGDDDDCEFIASIKHALKLATQKGLAIYFMHGNRDFLIGKKFLRDTGCVLLRDEEKISLYGTPVLLMHGDTLCTLDKKYLQMRNKFRNPFVQFLFLCLPLATRKKFVAKLRLQSSQAVQTLTEEMMDVTASAVHDVMRKHQVKFLIHGHTHKPAIHSLILGDSDAKRIVLGAWHERGNALVWSDDNQFELIEL